MATEILHVGDEGFVFRLTLTNSDGTVVDISAFTTLNVLFGKPDGSALTVNGTLVTDGTDGKLFYATVAGDIDQPGTWRIQVHVITPTWNEHSAIAKFKVKSNIA